MPLTLILAVLVSAAHATMCTGAGSCRAQAPQMCLAPPKGGACPDLSPEQVRKVFEGAMKKHGLDPLPRIVLAPEQEFVTFDCAEGRAKAGNSNTETNQCGDRHVVTVGRSVVDMSIACPTFPVTPAETLEAWALHEGAHVKLKHVGCRRLEIQRVCTAWASEPSGRPVVARLLAREGAQDFNGLTDEGKTRFRGAFVSACYDRKRRELDASARDQENEADALAQTLARPRALECALFGAIDYLKTIKAEEDTQHDSAGSRVLKAEERAAAEPPRIPLFSVPGDPF